MWVDSVLVQGAPAGLPIWVYGLPYSGFQTASNRAASACARVVLPVDSAPIRQTRFTCGTGRAYAPVATSRADVSPDVDHLASGSVSERRLSQAISEGDGISVLVEVGNGDAARRAEDRGAEGVVVRGAHSMLGQEIAVPLLAYGPEPEDAAASAAAAVVLMPGSEDDEALHGLAARCHRLGLELVVRVRDDDELERVLEHLDPEILLLTAELAEAEQPALDRVLELLPDVPAGKLAIAELGDASRDDVEVLERAGVDAVLVTGDVESLVGDGVPDV
jgi:hypothetical protein